MWVCSSSYLKLTEMLGIKAYATMLNSSEAFGFFETGFFHTEVFDTNAPNYLVLALT